MTAVILLTEGAAPSTPATNTHSLYMDTDGKLHTLSDGGVDKTLATTAITLVTANVEDAAITNAKLADMAEARIKGRAAAAGTGVPVDLTAAQVATILEGVFLPSGDATWTNLTLDADYVTTASEVDPSGHTYAVPAYRAVGGVVFLRGAARCAVTGTLLATLPAGYRPEYDSMYEGHTGNTSDAVAASLIWIYANGEIITTGANLSTYHLDGISFVPA